MSDLAVEQMTRHRANGKRLPAPSASSTSVPVADALRATVVSPFQPHSSPKIESGYELQPSKRLESCARRAHPNSLAGARRHALGQRRPYCFVSPAGTAPQSGKIDRQRKGGADRSDSLALAGNSILRIQSDPAVDERAANSNPDWADRQRGRSRFGTKSNALARKFRRQQPHHFYLPHGRGPLGERDQRITRKFSCGAGSLCSQSAATRLCNLHAVAAAERREVSQRSAGIGSQQPPGLRDCRATARFGRSV